MRPRTVQMLLVAALIASACAGSTDPEVTTDTGAEATTTTGSEAAGSGGATATTEATTTTLADEATTTTEGSEAVTFPAGFPTTWFGVRDDDDTATSFLEEHDSAAGTVIREVASYDISACIEEDDAGDCVMYGDAWGPVALDVTEDLIGVGMCCEPVSGTTQLRDRGTGDLLLSPFGSEPSFAPDGGTVAVAAYADGGYYFVVDTTTGDSHQIPVVPDWGDRASWSLDGAMIAVEIGDGIAVVFWDQALDEAVDISPTFTPPAGTTWSKPSFQASGNLVVAQDGGGATTGVVLNREVFGGLAAELVVAEFAYEGTVVHQGYDATGRFLIYVLDDGSVRWQGKGDSGMLAPPGSGHIAAAW
jgi:hypothetical protein